MKVDLHKMKMNKMLVLSFVIITLILVSTISVSAFQFDNRKSFDQVNPERLTIKNAFGFGADLVSVEKVSNTGLCLYECSTVWNVTNYDDGEDFLNLIEFQDLRDSQNKELDHKFEVLTGYEVTQVPSTRWTCRDEDDLSTCTQQITGTRTHREEIWAEFNPSRPLPVGSYLIKLTGYKLPEQSIDWVPTFRGERIDEWAFWIGVDPMGYWKFNEGSGNATDEIGTHNATNLNGTTYAAGKLDNASFFDSSLQNWFNVSESSGFFDPGTGNWTIAFWMNTSAADSSTDLIQMNDGSGLDNGGVSIAIGNENATAISIKDVGGKYYFTVHTKRNE